MSVVRGTAGSEFEGRGAMRASAEGALLLGCRAMQWTMPHRVLQIVAGLISLAAVSAFVMGVVNAPQRGGRLPGEKAAGAEPATAIDAADATPLSNERIEGPPEPTPEELAQAKADAEAKAEAEAGNSDAADQANEPPVITPPPVLRPPPPATTDTSGQTLGGPAAADEPPH